MIGFFMGAAYTSTVTQRKHPEDQRKNTSDSGSTMQILLGITPHLPRPAQSQGSHHSRHDQVRQTGSCPEYPNRRQYHRHIADGIIA
jgi:hypothetical protein